MKNLPPISPALWRQRYESLREHVLERRQVLGTDPLGLVVLFRRGLAAWMQSWWAVPAELSAPAALPQPTLYPSGPQWQQQLTGLLAQMTAQHL